MLLFLLRAFLHFANLGCRDTFFLSNNRVAIQQVTEVTHLVSIASQRPRNKPWEVPLHFHLSVQRQMNHRKRKRLQQLFHCCTEWCTMKTIHTQETRTCYTSIHHSFQSSPWQSTSELALTVAAASLPDLRD